MCVDNYLIIRLGVKRIQLIVIFKEGINHESNTYKKRSKGDSTN